MAMLLVTLLLLATPQLAGAEGTPDVGGANCIACGHSLPNPRALYSPSDWQSLERGSILLATEDEITASGSKYARNSSAAGLIRHAPDLVWKVLTDFETWPKFMPHITRTRVTRKDGSRTWVRQNYRVVFFGMEHTTVYNLDPRLGELSWSLDLTQKHDITSSKGRWQLIPANEGHETLIRYAAEMDAGRSVPTSIEGMLKKRSIAKLIANLRREVNRRYGSANGVVAAD